ncbi:PaaI family thioesterase [Phenylobacterium sp.]|uniref:PaaI family thioesterase n=1 Tax=Phenylobacterium sp. TaxID=1871053 RepID=UPI003BAA650E
MQLEAAAETYSSWFTDGADRLHEKQALSKWLTTRAVEFDESAKRLTVGFVATAEHTNFMERVHGGLVGSMLDEAASIAGVCMVGWKRFRGTVDGRVSFLKPVAPGHLVAKATLLRETTRLLFVEAELFGPQGDLCAKGGSLIAIAPAD